jgi:hypothetical protein
MPRSASSRAFRNWSRVIKAPSSRPANGSARSGSLIRDKENPGHQGGRRGFLDRTLSLRGLADHPIRVDPVRRTCPGAVRPLAATNIQLTGRAGGSDCNSLSVASARLRSRRNSFMRARIIAKSSAARGWVIGSSRSLDLVLTAARSFTSYCKAQRLLSGTAFMLPRCRRRPDIVGRMPSWLRRGYLSCRGRMRCRRLVLRKAVEAALSQLRIGDWATLSAHSCLPKASIGFEESIVTLALNHILPRSGAARCRVSRQGSERRQAGS